MLDGKTIFNKFLKRFLIAAIAIYLAFRLRQTLQLLLTSLFLAGAISPIIEKITSVRINVHNWRIGLNRVWAVVLLYLVLLIVVALAITPAPQIILELGQFFIKLPNLLEQIQLPKGGLLNLSQEQLNRILQTQPLIDQAQNFGKEIVSQTFGFTLQIFNAIGVGILSLLITAYMVINSSSLMRRCLSPFSKRVRHEVEFLIPPITRCLGAYVVGRIGTSTLLGFCTYLTLSLFGIPYSGALGLLVAISNLVPYIGGLVALIAIFIAAWGVEFNKGAIALFICFSLQQIEAFILQPWLVAPYLNLDPFELLLSIIVGAELFGIVGAIIAPPIAGTSRILFNHFASPITTDSEE
ncbi:MAG: AI-2E family transporter [Pseudanabaena sp.]|uniref:AI-2E family transporter n=1 Tax=Pseudanabaena mucicola TaxID=71190 RepID=UPI00257913C3|nr:AI-2E family transporter [Pseudanabaena mucicola]MCA6575672.1 AI-2E family transporter [Pseudanabaena sp. M53BS1SP1A06MG]MCA6582313.1 AI-2E family transporter [Pseudanabaena sp. M34BS1SP1A06MG]MCA6587009.1 AI-2E family transporter [Pseudanabaena sp. M051S1SP1A06QC]MCA6589248.1 AI-2E family transporter [Pseudanabaena sp. M109S1SP1A06QC]MCA6594114.1 AI-2E family transporter [Pseudanabaena sp. M38BS1SP1A06MG]MCA6598391.1 AI-2E family transporter [Pseudanabaena sp. M046S1SP1A06QC]MCA6601838.1